jgi:hypothetical protein
MLNMCYILTCNVINNVHHKTNSKTLEYTVITKMMNICTKIPFKSSKAASRRLRQSGIIILDSANTFSCPIQVNTIYNYLFTEERK